MIAIEAITTPFKIIIDGREKAPYTFTGILADANKQKRPLSVPWHWGYLKTGDYSIAGMEAVVAVERKSLADIFSTLGQHRDRFQAEHERLARMKFAVVIIEADWPTILRHPPAMSKLNPKTVYRTAMSWQQRYGVPWLTMSSRRLAEVTTFRILEKFYQHQQQK